MKLDPGIHIVMHSVLSLKPGVTILHAQIYEKVFIDNYTFWTKHGKPGVVMQDGEGDDDDNNIADWAHLYEAGAFEDEALDEAEQMDEVE